ncbi:MULTISPECIES: ATP-binding protein [unclassified Halorubrum]|uniref:ATP-binding protein n=1 Tax=unclassified Halorubrum TaxID=2642239 RepID=UPI0010F74498|nr:MULTISPECIES: ATP-binding protein [unclassified Halorubrum]TKX37207.1 PAS domain-containing protein [Halorubrum sp. CGM4_25_10-8A]TKX62467.1 PAS domain-containing protein [Halorubrum sp. GN12_10-3_MGM]
MAGVLTTPAGIAYISLFFISGIICFAAIPRARMISDADIRRGLVGMLVATGIWGIFKTGYFLVPDPLKEPTYIIGLVFGFGTVWAWLYFASAYSGRQLHQNSSIRLLSTGVFLTVGTVKVTNPLHGLYFTISEATTPFRYLAINHGIVHWIATGFSYVLAAVGLFMVFEVYVKSEYDSRLLAGMTGLLGLPVIFDLIAITTPTLIEFIYAPVGVAGFAVGAVFLFGDRLLAVGAASQAGNLTVIVDDDGRIKDYSAAMVDSFPDLGGSVGESLEDVFPELRAAQNGTKNVVTQNNGTQPSHYLVSSQSMGVGGPETDVLTLNDISERERQRQQLLKRERELDQRNELYRAILAASFSFVFRIDIEMRFNYVSESAESFVGYEPEELTGEHISVLAADDESLTTAVERLDEVTNGQTAQIRDHPIVTQSGRTTYIDMRLVPIYDPSVSRDKRTADDVTEVQVMVQDASQRRKREGLISVLNRVLRHNVRNELTVINGRAELLANELDGGAKSSAETIVQAGERLLDIAESARQIEENREVSPELQAVDIIPTVSDTIERLEQRHPEVRVTTELPDTAVAETLPRIGTAMWELLENVAEHTGSDPVVKITVIKRNDSVVLTIADEGPGIPKEEEEVLVKGKEQPLVHGQGLGLYLAYWIVVTVGADIEVSGSESGTTIQIHLPTPTDSS